MPGGHTALWEAHGGCETGPVVPKPGDPDNGADAFWQPNVNESQLHSGNGDYDRDFTGWVERGRAVEHQRFDSSSARFSESRE